MALSCILRGTSNSMDRGVAWFREGLRRLYPRGLGCKMTRSQPPLDISEASAIISILFLIRQVSAAQRPLQQ